MISAIDPTKPANDMAAVKADLRANLQAAKQEIESLQAGKAEVGHGHALATPGNDGFMSAVDKSKLDGLEPGGAVTTFTALTDTPGGITAGAYVRGAAGGDALEFAAASGANFTSVKDFGAVGNGSNNDTSEIQAALNSFGNEGGILFFPRGVYNHTGLDIPNAGTGELRPIFLVGEGNSTRSGTGTTGDGAGSTILKYTPTSGFAIDCREGGSGTRRWSGGMRGLVILGSGGSAIGLNAYDLRSAQFDNVRFSNFSTGLFCAWEYFYTRFDFCVFGFCTIGAQFDALSNGARFTSCRFHQNDTGVIFGKDGFSQQGSPLVLDNCYFELQDDWAMQIFEGQHVNISNCYIEHNADSKGGADIWIQSRSTNTNKVTKVAFRGNHYFPFQTSANLVEVLATGTGNEVVLLFDNNYIIDNNLAALVKKASGSTNNIRIHLRNNVLHNTNAAGKNVFSQDPRTTLLEVKSDADALAGADQWLGSRSGTWGTMT